MDSFHATEFKFGKPNGLGNLKRLGSVFRMVEIFVFLVMVWRVSFEVRFPAGECVRRFLSVLLSHRFVFVIGNVIVITLFAKSGSDTPAHQNQELNLRYESNQKTRASDSVSRTERTVSVPGSIDLERCGGARVEHQIVGVKSEDKTVKERHAFKRSYSDCLEVESYVKPRRILRRTVTEGGRGAAAGSGGDAVEGGGDGMSDEEFRVMVETFIAKQQRSLREEEKCLSYCGLRRNL